MFVLAPPGQGTALLQQLQRINLALMVARLTSGRVQKASAANRNIIVGNIGAVRTGTQDASPLNVGPQ
jgi:hypothetical protein